VGGACGSAILSTGRSPSNRVVNPVAVASLVTAYQLGSDFPSSKRSSGSRSAGLPIGEREFSSLEGTARGNTGRGNRAQRVASRSRSRSKVTKEERDGVSPAEHIDGIGLLNGLLDELETAVKRADPARPGAEPCVHLDASADLGNTAHRLSTAVDGDLALAAGFQPFIGEHADAAVVTSMAGWVRWSPVIRTSMVGPASLWSVPETEGTPVPRQDNPVDCRWRSSVSFPS
jgi:hypothetical protein